MAEIVILLNRLPPDWLIHQTDAAQFSLFCTPVINLFPRTTTRIEVTHSVTEQHLVVDRTVRWITRCFLSRKSKAWKRKPHGR